MKNHSHNILQDKRDTAPHTSYYHLMESSTALYPQRLPYLTHRKVNSIQAVQLHRNRDELTEDLSRVRNKPDTIISYI